MKKFIFICWASLILFSGCGSDDGPAPVMLSSEKELLSFQFLISENPIDGNVIGEVDSANHTVLAVLPGATLKSSLVPQIRVSEGASTDIHGAYDFNNEITMTVTAEDGTESEYTITVVNERDALISLSRVGAASWSSSTYDLENWDGVTMSNGSVVGLDLSNNNAYYLPPEIRYLSNLETLILSDNVLREIPDEIEGLKNLKLLSVGSNPPLRTISPKIGSLRSLEYLRLDNNPNLTSIPTEISQLSHLFQLDIYSTGLSAIPSEICEMEDKYETYISRGSTPCE